MMSARLKFSRSYGKLVLAIAITSCQWRGFMLGFRRFSMMGRISWKSVILLSNTFRAILRMRGACADEFLLG